MPRNDRAEGPPPIPPHGPTRASWRARSGPLGLAPRTLRRRSPPKAVPEGRRCHGGGRRPLGRSSASFWPKPPRSSAFSCFPERGRLPPQVRRRSLPTAAPVDRRCPIRARRSSRLRGAAGDCPLPAASRHTPRRYLSCGTIVVPSSASGSGYEGLRRLRGPPLHVLAVHPGGCRSRIVVPCTLSLGPACPP